MRARKEIIDLTELSKRVKLSVSTLRIITCRSEFSGLTKKGMVLDAEQAQSLILANFQDKIKKYYNYMQRKKIRPSLGKKINISKEEMKKRTQKYLNDITQKYNISLVFIADNLDLEFTVVKNWKIGRFCPSPDNFTRLQVMWRNYKTLNKQQKAGMIKA